MNIKRHTLPIVYVSLCFGIFFIFLLFCGCSSTRPVKFPVSERLRPLIAPDETWQIKQEGYIDIDAIHTFSYPAARSKIDPTPLIYLIFPFPMSYSVTDRFQFSLAGIPYSLSFAVLHQTETIADTMYLRGVDAVLNAEIRPTYISGDRIQIDYGVRMQIKKPFAKRLWFMSNSKLTFFNDQFAKTSARIGLGMQLGKIPSLYVDAGIGANNTRTPFDTAPQFFSYGMNLEGRIESTFNFSSHFGVSLAMEYRYWVQYNDHDFFPALSLLANW